MKPETTILLTNDDGLGSPSLEPLRRELARFARVVTVVPETQKSWVGKAITRHSLVMTRKVGENFYAISGTPADCAQLGIFHLCGAGKPALVVSGINLGPNIGVSHFFSSGTVGAAIEGAILGVNGVAFSKETGPGTPENARISDWSCEAAIAAELCRNLLESFPKEADLVNVNFPAGKIPRKAPWKTTRLTNLKYGSIFRRKGAGFSNWGGIHRPEFSPGTDALALERGFVSITPVKLSLKVPRIPLAQFRGRTKRIIPK